MFFKECDNILKMYFLMNYFSKNKHWTQPSICGLQFITKSATGIYRTTNAWTSSYNVTRLATWIHFFYNCDITCMDRLLRSRDRDMSPRHVSAQGQDQLIYMAARTILQQKEQTRITSHEIKKKLRGKINHEKKDVTCFCQLQPKSADPATSQQQWSAARVEALTLYVPLTKLRHRWDNTIERGYLHWLPLRKSRRRKGANKPTDGWKTKQQRGGASKMSTDCCGTKTTNAATPTRHVCGQSETGKLSDGGRWPKTAVACETRYRPLFLSDGALNQ